MVRISKDKDSDFSELDSSDKISEFRKILPQILACVAKSLILVDIGLSLGFPTIAIADLSLEKHKNPNERLHFNEEQASWFGSIIFICQPLGCILSGWITDYMGRKNAMLLVNIPHLIAWLMLYFASSVTEMYAAGIILGLGVGIMETPVVTYIGEICQPSMRGILTATTGVAVTIGYTMVYSLGSALYWRTVALICFSVPVLTIIVIFFVPETPLWLLVRGKVEKAQKSLMWLRGWVPADAIEEEFKEMQRYCGNAKKCKLCLDQKCDHKKYSTKIRNFVEMKNLKPFFIVTMFLVFTQLSGLAAIRPYLVQILTAYQVPMNAKDAIVIVGLLKLAANLTIMATVRFVGKRRLSLISCFGVSVCCLSIGLYAYFTLPHDLRSTDGFVKTENGSSNEGLFPLVVFFCLAFLTSLGMAPIPWMLLSELLPINARAITSGVSVTINYLIVFMATKTYLSLENLLNLFGVIWLYAAIGACGFVFLFFLLPETENRTLEEIEQHFATQPITNINISKIGNIQKGEHNLEDVELL